MEAAVRETRRIGEAQVRAYVDISSANVVFIRLTEGVAPLNDEQPLVAITAKNTGQSPARNFIWTPTVQLTGLVTTTGSDATPIEGDTGTDWRNHLGIGIPVGGEHSDAGVVTGILLQKFLTDRMVFSSAFIVRLRIQFEYEDAFDRRIADEAYFVGSCFKKAGQPPVQTKWGDTVWTVNILRISKPNDWPAKTENAAKA